MNLPPLLEKLLVLVVDPEEFFVGPRLVLKGDGLVRPDVLVKVRRERRVLSMHHGIDAGVHVSFHPFAVLGEYDALLLLALELDRVVFRVVRVKVHRVDQRVDLHLVEALLHDFLRDVGPVFRAKVVHDDDDVVVLDVVNGDAGAADVVVVFERVYLVNQHVDRLKQRIRAPFLVPGQALGAREHATAMSACERLVLERLDDVFPGLVRELARTRFGTLEVVDE